MTSETNHPELGQTSQVKGPALQKAAFTSDSCHKFGGPQATLTSDQLAVNLGVPTTPSDLVIHQTQLKKVLYLRLVLYSKRISRTSQTRQGLGVS